jgi:hypothetical protein
MKATAGYCAGDNGSRTGKSENAVNKEARLTDIRWGLQGSEM